MRKIDDINDSEAWDALAELIDPIVEITSDAETRKAINAETEKSKRISAMVKESIKRHKTALTHILAVIEGVPDSEYHVNLVTLPVRLLELLNSKEILSLFISSAQETGKESSGNATGIMRENEK